MSVKLPKETVKVLAELQVLKMIKDAKKNKVDDETLAKDIISKLSSELKFDVVDDGE
jgi:hypothetical protein